MQIADITIPDVQFPDSIEQAYDAFQQKHNTPAHEMIDIGIERLGLPVGVQDGYRLYAAMRAFAENPYNDTAAIRIAQEFADLGQTDEGVEILEQMESVGRTSEMWFEHPLFLAGWLLADDGQYDRALDAYHRLMKQVHIQPKAALLAHVGSVFHEVGRHADAVECYRRAKRNWEADRMPVWMQDDLLAVQAIRDYQVPFLDRAIAAAEAGEGFELVRSEDGLRNRMSEMAPDLTE